ncbi:MAG: hypothetical protein CM15mP129_04270 [Chloroflexota bacterium]|nr:MAG: hypothetical protein CM15mP129_04270 [Chloroflexota bacterium]
MAVISVKLGEPQFEGQTKAKLGNPEIESAVTSLMTQQLTEYLKIIQMMQKLYLKKLLPLQGQGKLLKKQGIW